ncbi:MAG: prepilin-type N-terminal cleavage/methylation domain-containing protein [Legionella longbeachae]|nr:prepilin-type N-terminal cleavage/methylation domain-containing protein [Legionella longbeachae]
MNQQKGFSLTEVLLSLLLVTTLALALLLQQSQSKQLLNQLVFHVQGSQLLDQMEESLSAQLKKLPPIPEPYHFGIQRKNQEILLNIAWFEQLGSITRKHDLYLQN